MNILFINVADKKGGAAIAAYRLAEALKESGQNVLMLVQEKCTNEDWVIKINYPFGKFDLLTRKALDRIPRFFIFRKEDSIFSMNWVLSKKLVKLINRLNPDIVHIHWAHGGMLRLEDVSKIKAPIVWTMHDMWLVTGGFHYCKSCHKNVESVVEKINIFRKKTVFGKKKINVIAISSWILNVIKESNLCGLMHYNHLPNCINTGIFKPMNKKVARKKFGLPEDRKIILFGAANPVKEKRKGLDFLKGAIKYLDNNKYALVIFGTNEKIEIGNIPVYPVGYLDNEPALIALYNASDLVVLPSVQENLSNVIMESLSCGVPVIAFDIGGNSDLIEHKKNGYLVKPFDTKELARGIEWVLNNDRYEQLSKNARETVKLKYDYKIIADKYIKMYKDVIKSYHEKN